MLTELEGICSIEVTERLFCSLFFPFTLTNDCLAVFSRTSVVAVVQVLITWRENIVTAEMNGSFLITRLLIKHSSLQPRPSVSFNYRLRWSMKKYIHTDRWDKYNPEHNGHNRLRQREATLLFVATHIPVKRSSFRINQASTMSVSCIDISSLPNCTRSAPAPRLMKRNHIISTYFSWICILFAFDAKSSHNVELFYK